MAVGAIIGGVGALLGASGQAASGRSEAQELEFQALLKAITLNHETSQQLAHQTRHVQLTCSAITKGLSINNAETVSIRKKS